MPELPSRGGRDPADGRGVIMRQSSWGSREQVPLTEAKEESFSQSKSSPGEKESGGDDQEMVVKGGFSRTEIFGATC